MVRWVGVGWRVLRFEVDGLASLGMWVRRRLDGVPAGATALPYVKEQAALLMVLTFVMVVETVAVDLFLNAVGVPMAVRGPVLVLDVYGVLFAAMFAAACATRPHVVTPTELRIRVGAYLDLRVPREQISAVRLARNYNEQSMVSVADGRLVVAISSQTNIAVDLTEPITVTRPLGGRAQVTRIRFFTDDPKAALTALRAPTPTH
ncbi:hypothetical protein ACIBHX_27345 [Nonomuraea sp. NPDC050536]|uniref:hypothetical protein n=1 Tax=Nonomuraea sp. NPDC050536 TaxID=3364366 RepID=UPI0037C830C2